MYARLRLRGGQLQALTGIEERRWWEESHPTSEGADAAVRRSLESAGRSATDLDVLRYAGVCREIFEPATACRVAALSGVGRAAAVFDVSNACLGGLNGIVDIASRTEWGQMRA